MPKYRVELESFSDRAIPDLLARFGEWLGEQPDGSVGAFDLRVSAIPLEWRPDAVDRLRQDGFVFLELPDGSMLALVKHSRTAPSAVVLLGSEGETETVATSLEEFLIQLSRRETGLTDLDSDGVGSRNSLKSWLSAHGVVAPLAPPFDFDAYLDGGTLASPVGVKRTDQAASGVEYLPTEFRMVVEIVGRRADDPVVIDYITNVLVKKVPASTTDVSNNKSVSALNRGVELNFNHDVKNEKYPLLTKSKTSFIPYVSIAWITPSFPGPLPFGLRFGMSPQELTACLGVSNEVGGVRRRVWNRVLDANRDIHLQADARTIAVAVDEAAELSSGKGVPPRPALALFVAWAVERGLINEESLTEHRTLLDAVRRREMRGNDLLTRALPRGLWDRHLKDESGLRPFAYGWFHNIGGSFIRDDLVSVFGSRKGPYGHQEAVLDDDAWANVDRVAAVFDTRFAPWINTKK